uniref:Non-specific serine/threonine protein kinase n=1 Tax=Chromera velia CCMP2878 TaxID=1169474 RepID=A0A0G4HHZ1_9ALVE|eukprot:Cvel_27668.t1-p1 / transcript=Cvel_27668.t1 / gene=Cvel_27668 / organism=Chromera_velia_CCMP2878 / gene_product=Probable serine/threonine-protein kinase fhkD, putative / transcript_product=Probable serine/threonine-protein kinase fhkD, putative / location=Cvel_scaffold3487:6185-15137(-) / protein_length=523 / sequence_SO=supercontig / SO=protein_coding / is_pseudo=false
MSLSIPVDPDEFPFDDSSQQTQQFPVEEYMGGSQEEFSQASQGTPEGVVARLNAMLHGVESADFIAQSGRDTETISIGRHRDRNQICVPDSRVSGVHAEIIRRGEHFFVVNRSQNGTYLGSRSLPVDVEIEFSQSDELSLVVNPDRARREPAPRIAVFAQWRFQVLGPHADSTPMRRDGTEREFFKKYKLGRRLGEGTFANVLSASRWEDGLWVAVKIVERRKFESWRLAQNSRLAPDAEIQTLREVNHKNCVRLLEDFTCRDRFFLVFEMCSGGDLFDFITKDLGGRGVPEGLCRPLFRMIVEGLHYLHGRKLAHRDLKPENILLTKRGPGMVLKISDFGLARRISDTAGGAQTFAGTPAYFAPEVIARRSPHHEAARSLLAQNGISYGLPVDLWCLGVVLYVMLGAEFPFEGDLDVFSAAPIDFSSPVWRSVSDSAKDLIENLMRVNPAERLTTAQVLEHCWLRGTEGGGEGLGLSADDTHVVQGAEGEPIEGEGGDSGMVGPVAEEGEGSDAEMGDATMQ